MTIVKPPVKRIIDNSSNPLLKRKRIFPFSVKIKWNIVISDAGYLHVPILHLTIGLDGFCFSIPTINVIVKWGNSLL